MIALEQVAARRAPLAMNGLTLSWGPGVHALLGGPEDGGALLLAIVGGRERPRAGHVRVLEGAPTDDYVRRQIGWVPLEPALPDALRVGEALAVAATVRGEPAREPAERLRALGIEALASRRVRSLSPEERRAVALAEAVTSTGVGVLLLHEPRVGIDPRAESRVADVLRARAREGSTVLVATASVREAGELADDVLVLRAGAVVGHAASIEALLDGARDGARLVIVCSDPRVLLATLAREAAVEAVARRDGAVVAQGRDPVALARAGARAILEAGVDVAEMRIEAPTLDEARAAATSVAKVTTTRADVQGAP